MTAHTLSTLDWIVVLVLVGAPLVGALLLIELERFLDARRRRRSRPGYVDLLGRRPW